MREEGGYEKILEACEKLSNNPQSRFQWIPSNHNVCFKLCIPWNKWAMVTPFDFTCFNTNEGTYDSK